MNSLSQNRISLDFHPLDYHHVEDILNIEKMVQYEPWGIKMFEDEVDHPLGFSWVALLKGRIVGYLCARILEDFLEILNIAVHPEYQGLGIGSSLLYWVINQAARVGGVKRAILEVRASNEVALRLYIRHGFKLVGEREGYYLTPGGREKALLMECRLSEK
ncbi:MAG: ribosomal protein S18-alanine N-acetyltransferase [Syntrophobacterales bacterium]|nr:ribosomal protein S18-alanine N-acetyltransferase [Syntrophobacterales bacterium]